MEHPSAYRNKQIIVIGLAKSGLAAAQLFHQYGAKVTVNDRKPRRECPEAAELEASGIHVILGSHPDDLIHSDVALVIKNPGIPYTAPPVRQALDMGIDVVTEVEVGWLLSPAPMIGITGSNGKTTTTMWIGEILRAAGKQPVVAGNIGRPLIDAAQEVTESNWLVAELSSFQLKGTQSFKPKIACVLNLAETHLDYHQTLDDYQASKANLIVNQTPEDICVLNADDDFCVHLQHQTQAQIIWFSMNSEPAQGVFLRNTPEGEMIVSRMDGRETVLLPVHELGIPGRHNVENALAAVAACLAAGVDTSELCRVLRSFEGVEHRLEKVADQAGVIFYNDSKATNPQATMKALEAFHQPIVLIAGGLERGMSYSSLVPHLKSKVKALVVLGETRYKLAEAAREAGLSHVKVVDTGVEAPQQAMDEALQAARAWAEPGDVVLLSPACASWDMFDTYEQRGSMFKTSVHTM